MDTNSSKSKEFLYTVETLNVTKKSSERAGIMKLLVHTHTSTRESMISHPHNLFTSQMKEEGIEGERREGKGR